MSFSIQKGFCLNFIWSVVRIDMRNSSNFILINHQLLHNHITPRMDRNWNKQTIKKRIQISSGTKCSCVNEFFFKWIFVLCKCIISAKSASVYRLKYRVLYYGHFNMSTYRKKEACNKVDYNTKSSTQLIRTFAQFAKNSRNLQGKITKMQWQLVVRVF